MRLPLPPALIVFLIVGSQFLRSEEAADLDWPTYRYDNQRSGQYPRDLPGALHLRWIHKSPHKPVEAWPGTAQSDWWRKRGTPEKKRVTFDLVYEVVGADDRCYYGSSADDQLRCLDLATGKVLWTFFAEAPIRLAPTVAKELILFGSDDGRVYALDRRNGRLRWRVSLPQAERERLPGNGRVMSLYPVRSSVLVSGVTGFFCSGLFPKSAGAWHCSVELGTGKLLDHKPISASPQGYLRERAGKLFLPTGRNPAGATISVPGTSSGKAGSKPTPGHGSFLSTVTTPNQLVGGGDGVVSVLRKTGGEETWSYKVEGKARSLAIVRGKLLVSTDQGMIYCFGADEVDRRPVETNVSENQLPPDKGLDRKIESVIGQLPHRGGYALVVDAATDRGALVSRLATLSEMHIIGLVKDAATADPLRRRLALSGIQGTRVTVHVEPSPTGLPYAKHMFNLVTSPRGLEGIEPVRYPDFSLLLRPGTGLAFFRGSATPSYRLPELEGVGEWTHMYADAGNTACSNDSLVGSELRLQWFGRPGPRHIVDRHLRTSPSLVKNGYMFVPGRDYLFGIDAWNGTILWEKEVPDFRRIGAYRDSGNLVATDEFVYAASGGHCRVLEMMTGVETLTLGMPEGFVDSHEWGYSGVVGEILVGSAVKKGSVFREMSYGAIYAANYGDRTTLTCSDCLFATDRKSGKPLWSYLPGGSILNPSIALSGEEVFFIEAKNPGQPDLPPLQPGVLTREDRRGAGADSPTLRQSTGRLDYPLLVENNGASLVCLGLADGDVRWRRDLPEDKGIQTLFVLYKERKVVVNYSRNAVAKGAKSATLHYETRVFRAEDGALAWSAGKDHRRRPNLDHGEQDRHPAIVGNRLIVEPHIYDLATGEALGEFKRKGGGCGTIAASSNSLYFRAGNPAAFDLGTGKQESINRVSRPGCWINMIPASGLLLVPEGSSGCVCNFAIQGSMAFAPK